MGARNRGSRPGPPIPGHTPLGVGDLLGTSCTAGGERRAGKQATLHVYLQTLLVAHSTA